MPNRFVRKLASFAPLSEHAIAALQQATLDAWSLGPRVDLIREGDRPGPVFVMLEGWAYRYKILPNGTRQVTAFLMPGDACDLHISMLSEMDHSIQTATAAKVATIAEGEMDRLMRDHTDFARAMYSAQLTDEGTLRAWIVSMGRRSSVERVAHLTCELYVRACFTGVTDGSEFLIPLPQGVLADALGMTTVHINRVLQQLKLANALTLKRGSILIVDPTKLAQIAGFDENYLHRRAHRIIPLTR